MRATKAMPPRPCCWASDPARRRRLRSSAVARNRLMARCTSAVGLSEFCRQVGHSHRWRPRGFFLGDISPYLPRISFREDKGIIAIEQATYFRASAKLKCPHCGRVASSKKKVPPKAKILCPACLQSFQADEAVLTPVLETIPLEESEPAHPLRAHLVMSSAPQPPSWTMTPQLPPQQAIHLNAPPPKKRNPVSIPALALGIISFVVCWIPFLGLLAFPLVTLGFLLGVIGLVLAIVGHRGGVASSAIGLALSIGSVVVAIMITGSISPSISKYLERWPRTSVPVGISPGETTTAKPYTLYYCDQCQRYGRIDEHNVKILQVTDQEWIVLDGYLPDVEARKNDRTRVVILADIPGNRDEYDLGRKTDLQQLVIGIEKLIDKYCPPGLAESQGIKGRRLACEPPSPKPKNKYKPATTGKWRTPSLRQTLRC